MEAQAQQTERRHETVVEIDAPVEAVWQAISDAEQITRWFAPYAKVEPGPDGGMVGGTMWLSWGEGVQGTTTIEIWEPNRRLRAVSERGAYDVGGTMEELKTDQAPARVAVDYMLEARGGTTVLRLVHSGFGRGAEWDAEFEGTRNGWPIVFRVLKHGLEVHPREPARQVNISMPVNMQPDKIWDRLLGAQLDGLRAGDHFSIRMPAGDVLEGTLVNTDIKGSITAVVENWNRTLMRIHCEDSACATKGRLTVAAVLYGPMADRADEIEPRWKHMLHERFAA